MRDFRQQFPFFDVATPAIYFDNAATTQKPQCVIDAINNANIQQSANVHRSSYQLASRVTQAYESARQDVAELINAPASNQVFWSKGATESLNLLAHGLGALCQQAHPLWQGDEIVLLTSEHHANILPWQQLVARCQSIKTLRITHVSPDMKGNYDYAALREIITDKTAIVAVAHVSNALGCVHPIAEITQWAHQHHALCIVDGTQALAHLSIDVQDLNCDAYVGSSHKMFGPTGVGFGYATHALLEALPPYQVGGEMIEYVSFSQVRYQPYPLKFEAGTPNIAGIIGMGAAARFIHNHLSDMQAIEVTLMQHLLNQFKDIECLTIIGEHNAQRISLCSFVLTDVSHYDVLQVLDRDNIALRVGHHCAMPLMQYLELDGTMRVSLCAYNTIEEIDMFVTALGKAIMHLSDNNFSDDGYSDDDYSDNDSTDLETTQQIHPLTLTSAAAAQNQPDVVSTTPIADQFVDLHGYDVVFRQIMLSSKACPLLQAQYHTDAYHVAGCEVDVWIGEFSGQFSGFATSKIIKGLLALLLEKANALDAEQRAQFNYTEYLVQLGVTHHLSQSRVDGLSRVIARLSV